MIVAIDGLTPIDELSKRLPVTQMDLETIIADFIDEGFLRPLSEREMLDRATCWSSNKISFVLHKCIGQWWV